MDEPVACPDGQMILIVRDRHHEHVARAHLLRSYLPKVGRETLLDLGAMIAGKSVIMACRVGR
jgi:hypothetical protein